MVHGGIVVHGDYSIRFLSLSQEIQSLNPGLPF